MTTSTATMNVPGDECGPNAPRYALDSMMPYENAKKPMSNMIFHGTETLTHVFCGRSPSGSNPKARRAHNRAATGSNAVIANNHGILKPMYTYTISAPNTRDDA